MKVLYDYQIFQMQKFGGISKGFCEFISRLPNDIEYEIAVKECNNVYLEEYGLKHDFTALSYSESDFLPFLDFRGKTWLYKKLSQYHLINSSESINIEYCENLFERNSYDVFHPTFFSPYFLGKIKKPFVLTVHDLTAEYYPEYFGRRNNQILGRKALIKKSTHIVVPSINTKRDLMAYYKVDDEKITVIYRGGPEPDRANRKSLYDFPYLLFVGLREGYKNFVQMVTKSIGVFRKYPDIHMVCTGRPFTLKELEMLSHFGIQNRFHTLFASEEEMKSLYANAICFIFPSESEGFGLPILEAFSYGCPVLLAKQSCLPEIGGDAALYIEDKNLDDIDAALEKILSMDENCKNLLRIKGYEQLQKFSWQKGSDMYANLYRKLI